MEVSREKLELASLYIDTINPKFELNYLYIDSENMVSSNTRALSVIKHGGKVEVEFYICKNIVSLALKQTKAKFFILSADNIVCLDKEQDELFTVSLSSTNSYTKFKYPEYVRILPKQDMKMSVPFAESSHIGGILATHGVLIDSKYIPKKFNIDFRGYIGINDSNLPIMLYSEDKSVQIVIMPIIDNFFKFNNEDE